MEVDEVEAVWLGPQTVDCSDWLRAVSLAVFSSSLLWVSLVL